MPRCVMALAVLALTASGASAQPLPWRTTDRVASGWSFTPGASFGLAWDSGIQTASHPIVEALFQKYVGRVNPNAEIDFIGSRTRLNAGYSGGLDKYWSASTGYEQHTRLSVSRVVSARFSAEANTSYSAAPTSDRLLLGTAAPAVNSTLPFVDVDASYVTAGTSFQYEASPRVTLSGAYRYQEVTLDRDELFGELEVLRDGRGHAPSLQIMRAFTPRLSIGASAEYRREVVGESDDFDIQTAAGAFTYQASPRTTVNGGVGASRLEIVGVTAATVAPTFYAGFDHAMRQLQISGGYSRGFHQLYGFGSLATSDTFSGGVSAPLLENVYYFSAEASFSRSREIQELALGFDLNTTWVNASVGRRLTEWLRAEAYLSISGQTSIVRGDSHRTRFGVQFATSRPMRME